MLEFVSLRPLAWLAIVAISAVAALPQATPDNLIADLPLLHGRYSIMHYFCFAAILCLLGSILLRRV